MIKCRLCHKNFRQVTYTHLRTHNTSTGEYRIAFPNAPLSSIETRLKCQHTSPLKGLSYEQYYGKEKAKEIGEKLGQAQLGNKRVLGHRWASGRKGLTYEQCFGIDKAKKIKKKMCGRESARGFLGHHHSKETIEKLVKAMIAGRGKCPTKLEMRLSYLLRHIAPNEFRYNGDGRLGLSFDGLVPDFVNVNGQKKVIEVFCTFWKENVYGSVAQYKKVREKRLAKLGFSTLFIEGTEFADREKLRDKIQSFVGRN